MLPKYAWETKPSTRIGLSLSSGKEQSSIRSISRDFMYYLHREGKIYCKKTTLHGLYYAAESSRPWIERLIWAICFILAFSAAIYLTIPIWNNYQMSLLSTVVESTDHPLSKIPFPSVTICSKHPIKKGKLREYLKRSSCYHSNENLRDMVRVLLEISSFRTRNRGKPRAIINRLEACLSKSGDFSVNNLLEEVRANMTEFITGCMWKESDKGCEELFQTQWTELGLCYSFNNRLSLPIRRRGRFRVRRTTEAGSHYGLEITVIKSPEWNGSHHDYAASVMVQNTDHFPDAVKSYLIPIGTNTLISITASDTVATNGIKSVPMESRQCVFPEERDVTIGVNYTQRNCLMMCRMDRLVRDCNCVPFFYPDNDRSDNECNLTSHYCILNRFKSVLKQLQTEEDTLPKVETQPNIVSYSPKSNDDEHDDDEEEEEEDEEICRCPPLCSRIVYTADVTYLPNTSNNTTINVYFKDSSMVRYRTDVEFGWQEFVASIGGIAGLCLGGSLLSLIELVYFFTVRLGVDFIRWKRSQTEDKSSKTQLQLSSAAYYIPTDFVYQP